MHIAVVGCGHGEIDKIYEVISHIEQKRDIKVSLVLCCGDFQSVRNMTDLRCMACPIKYQQMHDFHRYYSGEKKAPILTLFIGGNHEASNFLQELPYGGWVAPNIYYLGNASVVRFGPVRIAGLSGIYKGQDYLKGRFECPPYDQGTMRSVYHYRNLDIFRMKQLRQHVDIVLSHDWPKGIHRFGDTEQLLRRKPFFREEIEKNELGSRPLFELVEKLQPSYWFSAHMHVKFAAYIAHNNDNSSAIAVEGEPISNEIKKVEELTESNLQNSNKVTKFLALDKVLPRRQFLQIIEFPDTSTIEDLKLEHDSEWLAVLKLTNHLISTKPKPCFMPGPGCQTRYDYSPTKEEVNEILEIFQNDFEVKPESFTQTGPIFQPSDYPQQAFPQVNPQTVELCLKLGLTDPIQLASPESFFNPLLLVSPNKIEGASSSNSYLEMESQLNITYNRTSSSILEASINPDEISLDEDEIESSQQTARHDSNGKQEQSHTRSRLVLPPPKSSDGEVTGENPEQKAVSEEELGILKSIMGDTGDSTEIPSGLFFIDTQGEEPKLKRRKDP